MQLLTNCLAIIYVVMILGKLVCREIKVYSKAIILSPSYIGSYSHINTLRSVKQ